MSSYSSPSGFTRILPQLSPQAAPRLGIGQRWLVFAAAIFLIVAPVFIEAPLVRTFPWLSLSLTVVGLGVGLWLMSRPAAQIWGDLLIGFSWIWLSGSIYWGWWRWEPLLHLPIEAVALPIVLACLLSQKGKVGSYFYLGSLLGTTVTDIYFYWVDLIPAWRQLMQAEPSTVHFVLQAALDQMNTAQGIRCAEILLISLLIFGLPPLKSKQLHWWAFSGAVLSTILVDSLFFLAALLA
ncbi:MAG: DUF3120 domain-containing protein [Leptolyngbyaceae cyanobacterium MO_188.B28]|nr:DUF3120 domain-containing protein [Leptolyngbyaceae cyanobacterium MO_188.B28]